VSILNVWVERQRALVCVDTQGVGNDGTRGDVTKLAVLPHINAVLACRGHLAFLSTCWMMMAMSSRGFDELVEAMSTILPLAFQNVVQTAGALGVDPATLDRQTLVFVGWSPRAQRMIGREWMQETAAQGFVADDIDPHHIAPWHESMPNEDPNNAERMQRLAAAQVRSIRENAPHEAAGGRLIVAELTRHATVMRHRRSQLNNRGPRQSMSLGEFSMRRWIESIR
jgi:hypothetical protein